MENFCLYDIKMKTEKKHANKNIYIYMCIYLYTYQHINMHLALDTKQLFLNSDNFEVLESCEGTSKSSF